MSASISTGGWPAAQVSLRPDRPTILVLVGVGDLAKAKLLHLIAELTRRRRPTDPVREAVFVDRRDWNRDMLAAGIAEASYVKVTDGEDPLPNVEAVIARYTGKIEAVHGPLVGLPRVVLYSAVPPDTYPTLLHQYASLGARAELCIALEKPLATSKAGLLRLESAIADVGHLYRDIVPIDHYSAKATVRRALGVLATVPSARKAFARFTSAVFMADESITVPKERRASYGRAGATADMLVHLATLTYLKTGVFLGSQHLVGGQLGQLRGIDLPPGVESFFDLDFEIAEGRTVRTRSGKGLPAVKKIFELRTDDGWVMTGDLARQALSLQSPDRPTWRLAPDPLPDDSYHHIIRGLFLCGSYGGMTLAEAMNVTRGVLGICACEKFKALRASMTQYNEGEEPPRR